MTNYRISEACWDNKCHRPTFGAPGSEIQGSRFIRDYCARCDDPLRVRGLYDGQDNRVNHYCESCSPNVSYYQRLSPRQESVRRRQSDRSI